MNKAETWLLQEKYQGKKSEAFFADCARLQTGEPLAYVIGWVPFLECKIYLGAQPDRLPSIPSSQKFTLIPRPETEFWTLAAITEIKKYVDHASIQTGRILDLCAGSGCIGVAVAKALPEVGVDFAEIDAHFLPLIEKNLHHNLSRSRQEQYRIINADLFKTSPRSRQGLERGRYDFILSNPPYIDPALDRTQSSVKNFEPHQALYGGEAGLELIAAIITEAPQYLKPGGQLWLEHEPEQSSAIATLAGAHGYTATVHTDQYGEERYSVLVLN